MEKVNEEMGSSPISPERQAFLDRLKKDMYVDYNEQRYVFIDFDNEEDDKAWVHPAGKDTPELVEIKDIDPPDM